MVSRLLLSILLLLCLSSPAVQADTTITETLGVQAACDPALAGCRAIPLSASLLCDGGGAILDCPQYFAPDWAGTGDRFFGISNRVNPPRCVQSTNGGSTWGLCPSNPFSAAIDNFGAFATVASDGSLIVAADQGANNCIIRRSIDYGTTWATVYTDATVNITCGSSFTSPTPSPLKCSSNSSYCVVVGRNTGTFDKIPYYSIDNGATWNKGAVFNIVSTDDEMNVALASDASSGLTTPYGISYNNWSFGYKVANVFIKTGNVPLPAGAGVSTRCAAPSLMGASLMALCGPDSVFTSTYRLFFITGGVPILTASYTLAGSPVFSQAPDLMGIGYASDTAYIVIRNSAGTRVLVFVTRDTFASTNLIATLNPITPLGAGCCRGDILSRNGKMYFTSGFSGANAFFGVIQ